MVYNKSRWLVAAWGVLCCAALSSCSDPGAVATEPVHHRFDPIVGGYPDTDPAHDAVVYLKSTGGGCSGSLISQPGQTGVILTARHCVSHVLSEYVTCDQDFDVDMIPSTIKVFAGHDPDRLIGRGSRILHNGGSSLCNNDIALLILDRPVFDITPLRVRLDTSTRVGETFRAIGYGRRDDSRYAPFGQRYARDDVEILRLGPPGGTYLGEHEFVGGPSTCPGDSGGPAVSKHFAVVGVASRGSSPCSTSNGVWGEPNGYLLLLERAMFRAGSGFLDENGTLHGSDAVLDAGADSDTPDVTQQDANNVDTNTDPSDTTNDTVNDTADDTATDIVLETTTDTPEEAPPNPCDDPNTCPNNERCIFNPIDNKHRCVPERVKDSGPDTAPNNTDTNSDSDSSSCSVSQTPATPMPAPWLLVAAAAAALGCRKRFTPHPR